MTLKPAKQRSQRSRGSVLMLISLLMIGSAVIRLGLEAGPALAKGSEPAQPSPDAVRRPEPDVQVLLKELLRREAALEQREAAILDKQKAMEIADQAIEAQLIALEQAEDSLRATLAIADTAAEADLTRLTDVYQNMKPKDAAALFETMDPSFAAGFLSRMPADKAAGIMAGLNPEVAYTFSVVLAGRNANAPQE